MEKSASIEGGIWKFGEKCLDLWGVFDLNELKPIVVFGAGSGIISQNPGCRNTESPSTHPHALARQVAYWLLIISIAVLRL